jgi:cytochrome c biogenesis protein
MRFALALLLVLAVFTLLGTLIGQMPSSAGVDANARQSWLAGIRPRYGGWTDVIDSLGLFNVWASVWFRAVVGLLTLSLLACSMRRIPGAWHTAVHPRVDAGAPFFEHAPLHDRVLVARDGDALKDAAVRVLRDHRYRTIVADDGTVHLYADRNRWTPMGSIAAHLSMVLILLGAVVGTVFGFRDDQFLITEGTSAAIPGVAGAAIRLDAFRDAYHADTGAPADYASDLTVLRDGEAVLSQTVRVNEPLRYADLSFYQSFYGPAALVSVTDATGRTVLEQGVPLAWTAPDGQRRIGAFVLPDSDLSAWVIGTGGAGDAAVQPGQVRVEVYRTSGDGGLVAAATIDQRGSAELLGYTVSFQREVRFTGLMVARDPGVPLVWLGGLLLFLGIVAVFVLPPRRLWGRLAMLPTGGASLALASTGRSGDVAAQEEFDSIVDEIRTASVRPHGA